MGTSIIHYRADIHPDCRIGEHCVIEKDVIIESGVVIGHHVIIHAGTKVGANSRIGNGSILGCEPARAATSTTEIQALPSLSIGNECIIGNNVVLYRGTAIREYSFFGDNASVRENCQIGSFVLIGQKVTVESQVVIGDYSKIQTGAYITAYSQLADHVFIAPMVTTTNDNYMGRTEKRFASRKGAAFERGCRVGGGAHILPGITIGEEAFVATGSVVTRNVPPYQLVMGTPAHVVRPVPEDELMYKSDTMENKPIKMEPVSSFDLKRQNDALKDEIRQVLDDVIGKGQFILGENVKMLEEEIARLCGAKYGIGVANGSDALYLALDACGIGPGDEVITTPFTFFATAGSIARVGAVPVFVDIDPLTFNIDPVLIKSKLTPRTRALLPVHLYGQAAEMAAIMDMARAHGLKVIEDAAQAIGARYQDNPVGGLGDAGCISFFPTKNLGCFGDGGMVVTNHPDLAERLRMLRVHGGRKKYHHELLGINSRLDELQAAILKLKLPYLQGWIEKRRRWSGLYDELLKESGLVEHGRVVLPYQAPQCYHVFNQYTVRVQDRDRLQAYLRERGIGTSIYYPLPLHLQVVFKNLGYEPGDFPNAEQASHQAISLPMFPELTEDEIRRVVAGIKSFYGTGENADG